MRSEKQIKAWKRNFTLFVLSGIRIRKSLRETKTDQW